MGVPITDDLVLDALTMGYWCRRPPPTLKLHSDWGSQYSSHPRKKLLKAFKITPSMSNRGNYHDSAVAESFFANSKKEKIRRKRYRTRAEARLEIFDYIELFYKPKRRHTHNGLLAPTVYEQRQLMK